MYDLVNAPGVDNLEELEQAAQQSTQRLNQANGRNAVWDKALKALKPGLADLEKIREEAGKAATEAREFVKHLEESYDSDTSNNVRKARQTIDEKITGLENAMKTANDNLNAARNKVAKAKNDLDESTAKWDLAQKNLLALPKDIQDGQKLIGKLQGEAKDADAKHLLVEPVVKLEDLKKELASLDDKMKDEYITKRWQEWNNATRELIARTDALLDAQTEVPKMETAAKEAKIKYEETFKNRLDDIKKEVADKPANSAAGHYLTDAAM